MCGYVQTQLSVGRVGAHELSFGEHSPPWSCVLLVRYIGESSDEFSVASTDSRTPLCSASNTHRGSESHIENQYYIF